MLSFLPWDALPDIFSRHFQLLHVIVCWPIRFMSSVNQKHAWSGWLTWALKNILCFSFVVCFGSSFLWLISFATFDSIWSESIALYSILKFVMLWLLEHFLSFLMLFRTFWYTLILVSSVLECWFVIKIIRKQATRCYKIPHQSIVQLIVGLWKWRDFVKKK